MNFYSRFQVRGHRTPREASHETAVNILHEHLGLLPDRNVASVDTLKPTLMQLAFFYLWIAATVTLLIRIIHQSIAKLLNNAANTTDVATAEENPLPNINVELSASNDTSNSVEGNQASGGVPSSKPFTAIKDVGEGNQEDAEEDIASDAEQERNFSKLKPPPSFDNLMKYLVVFGGILLYFYLCDYDHIFPRQERTYSRDLFLFLCVLLVIVAGAFTLKPCPDSILGRDQTEEWKGWMQVMFVWYHYYAAKETYNYIRVFIASYVWMTGFGNFSFFWVRKDYSLWRLLKMLFRLNFLVVCVCVVTNNEYMLYYICAMHTYWFLSVYAFMRILSSWNEHRWRMAAKFLVYFVCNTVIFDVPHVGETLFTPFKFLLGYKGGMHEWMFRAGLDHHATLLGMLCAYNYPNYEKLLNYLEKKCDAPYKRILAVGAKVVLSAAFAAALYLWQTQIMYKEKFEYNAIHPYTSWIPILSYIFFRNLFPLMRSYHLDLFAWLGKITLETYISQLHVYMQDNARQLIVYIPGYPLVNFLIATMIYVTISYFLFHLTTEFSAYLLPKDLKVLLKKVCVLSILICLAVLLAFATKRAGFL
ncbi:PREDICTED: protein REDUCED WALL ACETYLATION 4-like [Branchiostoma belcheri]|uniref:Protein REDUCED WALL ACETYLATION 4-like n=1 Tax=Branchiostoma belcheri TaxID=7741 RepID=A0A6P4Z6C3_BRABE|nr:PREDICTED: protein REDUCED WALL ACETYLATION 4-like [Branchiostoma belcheri]